MLSQLETKTSDSLGAFIRGDWMSYSSRCCYSVSIEVQQKPCAPTAPRNHAFITFRVWSYHFFKRLASLQKLQGFEPGTFF